MKKELRVLETFSGIGAIRQALEKQNYNYNIVDSIEVDSVPLASYNAIYGERYQTQDISTYNKSKEELGEIDLFWNSSPCQDISIAGKNAGAEEGSGTRSSLVYETIRLIKEYTPKYIIWENVKNLLSKKHKHILDDYIDRLKELGYNSYYQVLNAQNYGLPQARERVFVVSIRADLDNGTFVFPEKQKSTVSLKDFLEEDVDSSFYVSDELAATFKPERHGENIIGKVDSGSYECGQRVYDINRVFCTLRAKKPDQKIYTDKGIRYLTPKECWRLMGFRDEDYEKAAAINSKSSLYKQAGNSVAVNCIEAILDNLLKDYQ